VRSLCYCPRLSRPTINYGAGCAQARLRALGQSGPGQRLLEEPEPQRFLELGRSKDGRMLTLNASTKTSSEARRPPASSTYDRHSALSELVLRT
jgi:hypothetical protein